MTDQKQRNKHGEENVSASEAKLRAILDTAIEGIITITKEGVIESINPAALKMFGYELEEIVGQNVKLLMPSPYQQEHDSYLSRYVNTGEKRIIGVGREVVGLRKNGSTFPMYLSVGEMWINDRWYFNGIVRDITDQKRIQARGAALGRILEETKNEVYIFDAVSLRFNRVNRQARENLGYSMDELRTLTPLDLEPKFDTQTFVKLTNALRDGEDDHIRFETEHRRKDGSFYPVEVSLQLADFGNARVFVAIVLDITDRRRTEQEQRLAAVGEMVTGIAHESRNALQRIQTGIDLLQEEFDDNSELASTLRLIRRGSDDLQGILEEVRGYAAPIRLELSTCNLSEIWQGAWSNLRAVSQDRGGRLIEHTNNVDLQCEVDAHRLEQVFQNLFQNSISACAGEAQIAIHCAGDSDVLVTSVRDSGPGLSDEVRERLFDAFFTTKSDGTGLGMPIVKRLVEAHGGQIEVGDKLRDGAEFIITLPRNPQ